jgi:cob(I)alamin adenosyltransferase
MKMSISTRTGDKGETSLFTGERVPKDHPLMQAIGDCDELNAVLAIIRADSTCTLWLKEELFKVQNILFRLGGDLATPLEVESKQERMSEQDVKMLDALVSDFEAKLPEQHAFLLPGGTSLSAHLHLARTVCRRVERDLVTLARSERVNPECLRFINRLSDVLFLCARKTVIEAGEKEEEVKY